MLLTIEGETDGAQSKLNCTWREGSTASEQLEKILIQTEPSQKKLLRYKNFSL